MLPALLAVLATGLSARQASATCALGACIDARPTWSGGREDGNSRPERECPACDEADRRAAAAAEAYALSHIPEPSELPRADTVAEREQDTVTATEKNETRDHKAILACAIVVGGTTRNPFAAGLILLGGYYLVTHPSADLGRLPMRLSWQPEGGYVPAPKVPPAFPELRPAKRKTPVQGGGGLRKRWVDPDGNIYEWDYQHGRVEKYNKRGKHQGEYDAETGKQTKPADPEKKVEP